MQSMAMGGRRCLGQAPRRLSRGSTVRVRAEVIEIPQPYSKVMPQGDRVLVKIAKAEEKTRGGILLPVSAMKRPTSGDVVSVGDGKDMAGNVRKFTLKAGDTVLYSKFGFMYHELKVGEQEYILIREEDVIAIMPRSGAQAEDIPQMKPLSDRVLVRITETADLTVGGVILPEGAKERPVCGTVEAVGPGKYDKDKPDQLKPMNVKPGDKILYFKYAGDAMETPDGSKFVVLREDDILCRA